MLPCVIFKNSVCMLVSVPVVMYKGSTCAVHSPVAWQQVNKVVSTSEGMGPNLVVKPPKIEDKYAWFGYVTHLYDSTYLVRLNTCDAVPCKHSFAFAKPKTKFLAQLSSQPIQFKATYHIDLIGGLCTCPRADKPTPFLRVILASSKGWAQL